MKLTNDLIESIIHDKSNDDIKKVVLDNLNLSSADALAKYEKLEFISIRFNQLKTINFVSKCQNLWVLELQQNIVN